ncbi:MAG: MFS transporter [Paludibacteraceae bacterium]|nr:MFS transporter [Paludibacteraceae bacterium]
MDCPKDRLFTMSFVCSCSANFLLFFSFYLIMPILAMYLIEVFTVPESTVGAVLSCYTLACLFVRPFSGYLVDTFQRKPLYLMALSVFVLLFAGYPCVKTVFLFALLRVMHGLAFGMVSISSNTIVIDIMPSSRRGEGLGYFGLSNNFAMATGPMVGMWLLDHYSYETIFYSSFCVSLCSFLIGSLIKTKYRPKTDVKEKLSLDRFFLKKGVPAGINLFFLAIPYGVMTSFIALYAKELSVEGNPSFFYLFLASGIALSRIFSGKLVDRGKMLLVIKVGIAAGGFAYLLLGALPYLGIPSDYMRATFFGVALLIGMGYGTIFPAMNSLFVALAPNNKRGTATSTYLTSWDIGIGVGLFGGGCLSEWTSFSTTFCVGGLLDMVALTLFASFTASHFLRNRVRES